MIEIYYMTWNTSSNEGKCMFLLKTFGLICAAYGILSVLTGCDSTVGFKSQVRTETWEAVVILENEPRVPDADQPSIQTAGQENSISVPDVALENMAVDKSEKTVSRKSAGREPVRSPAASAPKAVSASPAANEPKAYYELDEIEEPETF